MARSRSQPPQRVSSCALPISANDSTYVLCAYPPAPSGFPWASIDICRVLIRIVVVPNEEVAAEITTDETGHRVERQMKQIVALPVDNRRHDVERDPMATVLVRHGRQ